MPPAKILQFGGGNFLRAFADWMVAILNQQTGFNGSVIVVKPTSNGNYKTLRDQNGAFHVVLNGIKNGKPIESIQKIEVISDIIHPYTEWTAFLKSAAIPSLRFIISNTTEAGIVFNKKDKFNLSATPHEFPAKLTIWLYRRFKIFGGAPDKGCFLLPLELIADNGSELKACVLKYANYWKLELAFSDWINQRNFFCSTLVDRIVSGFPTKNVEELMTKIGEEDHLLVAAETYHSWIIQGPESIQKELPFAQTDLNVTFTQNLDIHRQIKVRLLNGAHTAMVPVGLLSGVKLVSEAMDHPQIRQYIESLLLGEVIPTIDYPIGDLINFAEAVFNRFLNPAIAHQLISISLNSTSKFIARLSFTLRDYLQLKEALPKKIVFALAALICLYKGEINGEKIPLKDKTHTLQFISNEWSKLDGNYLSLVQTILKNKEIWGTDLDEIPNLSNLTSEYLKVIDNEGVSVGLNWLV